MESYQILIDKLTALRNAEKFTDDDWAKRGLIPSSRPMINNMIRITDMCLDELIASMQSGAATHQLKKTLLNGLERFTSGEYDTEEKEFISDEFYRIGELLGFDVSDNLDDWMLGREVAAENQQKKNVPQTLETITVACEKCNKPLSLQINAWKQGVPIRLLIVKCTACGENNLAATKENTGAFKLVNMTMVEVLKTSDRQEALIRLEQLRAQGKR